MRNGYTRARDIEREARALIDWVDTFVEDVRDHNGQSLIVSWEDVIEDLRWALRPLGI